MSTDERCRLYCYASHWVEIGLELVSGRKEDQMELDQLFKWVVMASIETLQVPTMVCGKDMMWCLYVNNGTQSSPLMKHILNVKESRVKDGINCGTPILGVFAATRFERG